MKKALPILVIASIMLSLIPSMMFANAAVTATLSTSLGYVGDKVVVSGTINTFNGRYMIEINANGDGVTWVLLTGAPNPVASGYAFSKEITIPNCYAGGRNIRVSDIDAGLPLQSVTAIYTVQTKYTLAASADNIAEAGTITLTATITGGQIGWVAPNILDIQFRVKDPAGLFPAALTNAQTNIAETTVPGRYVYPFTPANDVAAGGGGVVGVSALATHGTYTCYIDWDTGAVYTNNAGVATTTFAVTNFNLPAAKRTQTVNFRLLLAANVFYDYFTITDPAGTLTTTNPAGVVGQVALQTVADGAVKITSKTDTLGTYTVKFYDNSVPPVLLKTATFTLSAATITPTFTSVKDNGVAIAVAPTVVSIERMHKVRVEWTLDYPVGNALPADLPGTGYSINVYYNTTLAKTVALDPLVNYDSGANKWFVEWTIPKDAVKGTKYQFNITASSITDVNGNTGPTSSKGTGPNWNFFTVTAATLVVSTPTLVYPGAGNTVHRTLEAKASLTIKYSDGSAVAPADLTWGNVTIKTIAGSKSYILNLAASDYNGDVNLWVAKWKIPYNAPKWADYRFYVDASDVTDKFGNGANAITGNSGLFGVDESPITVSDVAVDKTSVQTDEQITVSFKATYASGDPVTTKITNFQKVDIVKPDGTLLAAAIVAGYDSTAQKWKVAYIIPTGSVSGKYNATIQTNYVQDDVTGTPNIYTGAKKYVNFDVSRVSMTDILAASDAAKASSDLAQTKADAAKTAADTAATKADNAKTAADAAKTAATQASTDAKAATTAATAAGTAATAAGTAATAAKTSADAATAAATSAGTKADAAKTAADGAKAAADNAAAAANGLTTLVYAAIGASLIAALAAIVALMQISRKIA